MSLTLEKYLFSLIGILFALAREIATYIISAVLPRVFHISASDKYWLAIVSPIFTFA